MIVMAILTTLKFKLMSKDNNDSDVCEKICEMNPAVAAITGDLNICRLRQRY